MIRAISINHNVIVFPLVNIFIIRSVKSNTIKKGKKTMTPSMLHPPDWLKLKTLIPITIIEITDAMIQGEIILSQSLFTS